MTTGAGPHSTDPVTAPWWDATRERQFVLQRCADCGSWQHYPRTLCVRCGSADVALAPASGLGTVDSFTVVHRSAEPAAVPPYVVARVRTTEGPVLLTHLVEDAAAHPRCDMPVQVAWRPLPDGRQLPVFRGAAAPAPPDHRTPDLEDMP